MHPAHGRADNESRVCYSKALSQETVLGRHHIDVTVTREFRVQPIARFTRFTVTDPIRHNDVKFGRVQRLTFSKQFPGKLRPNELRATAGRTVHYQDLVSGSPLSVLVRFAEGPIMSPQFRQRFT